MWCRFYVVFLLRASRLPEVKVPYLGCGGTELSMPAVGFSIHSADLSMLLRSMVSTVFKLDVIKPLKWFCRVEAGRLGKTAPLIRSFTGAHKAFHAISQLF